MNRKRKALLIVGGALLLFLLVPVIAVLKSGPPPAPDLATPIDLPDGRTLPLGEVLSLAEAGELEPPAAAEEPVENTGETAGEPSEPGTELEQALRTWEEELDLNDVYDLAQYALAQGDVEQGAALLASVPEDHPRYARAMRMLGWDLYARELGRPGQGVGFVNRSLMAEPFSGNAWQDAYRVYWRALTD